MNFLAHTLLSPTNDLVMLGNLCGDFIKGNPVGKLVPDVAKGVVLHRKIDSFTDEQDEFKAVRELLRPQFKLFSGAIVDMFFDFCLARTLTTSNVFFYEQHVKQVYQLAEVNLAVLPVKFHKVLPYMRTHNWLGVYGDYDGLQSILSQMSRRVNRGVYFEDSLQLLKENEEFVTQQFTLFWHKIVQQFESRFLL